MLGRIRCGWAARKACAALIVGAPALLFSASAADAGTYYVTQTCGAWGPFNNAPARLAVYTECPALVVRNVGGPFSSAAGQEGRWDFYAPPGTAVSQVSMSGAMRGVTGWQATILTSTGAVLETCPASRARAVARSSISSPAQ